MKSKKNKKQYPNGIDLIICSDFHLMEKQPICRTDDFWKAQWDKIKKIQYLAYEFSCPIYHAGDFFDHWKTSPYLLNKTIQEFKPLGNFYTIIGNHDQPAHNMEQMDKSGLQTLFDTHTINQLDDQCDWGTNTKICKPKYIYYNGTKKRRSIIFAHIMTYKDTKPWPGCTDPECHELFDIFPDVDLIVTGHNHKSFTAKQGNRLLVNPGSLTRHKADQIDHKPCVFLYSAKEHKLYKHYLEIKKNVINREHIEIKKSKEKRINAFIEKLNNKWDITTSFEENLEIFFNNEKIPKKIKNIIYEWLDEKIK